MAAVSEPFLHDTTRYNDPEKVTIERWVGGLRFEDTVPEFSVFGAGRGKCPGRFLAAAQNEVLVGKVVDGWELGPVRSGEGRCAKGFGWNFVVLPGTRLRIRKKEGEKVQGNGEKVGEKDGKV